LVQDSQSRPLTKELAAQPNITCSTRTEVDDYRHVKISSQAARVLSRLKEANELAQQALDEGLVHEYKIDYGMTIWYHNQVQK
jgi:hypothetical protein